MELHAQLARGRERLSGAWRALTAASASPSDRSRLQGLTLISDQLAALQAGTAIAPQPAPGPAVPARVFVVPTSLADLWDTLIAVRSRLRGWVYVNSAQVVVAVPAFGATTLPIPPPAGYVTVLRHGVSFATTNAGADVTTAASVDGVDVISATGFTIGPGGQLDVGQGFLAETTGLEATFTNPSNTAATIYVLATGLHLIVAPLYGEFVRPVLDSGYDALARSVGFAKGLLK